MCIFELVQIPNIWDSSGWLYNIHAIVLLYNRAIVQDTRYIKLLALLCRLMAKDKLLIKLLPRYPIADYSSACCILNTEQIKSNAVSLFSNCPLLIPWAIVWILFESLATSFEVGEIPVNVSARNTKQVAGCLKATHEIIIVLNSNWLSETGRVSKYQRSKYQCSKYNRHCHSSRWC